MGKKQNIVASAKRLFSEQGYDSTTTLQITREAGVTEPAIYYHFKGKEDLFNTILESAFSAYFERLDTLPENSETQFEKIENLITLYFELLDQRPHEIRLIVSTCPAKLKDPEHICSRNIRRARERVRTYVERSLEAGIRSGEFFPVPVAETAGLLMAMINGLIRQRSLDPGAFSDLKDAAVAFCKRSLVSRGFR